MRKKTKRNKIGSKSELMLTCQSVLGNKVVLTRNVYDHIINRHPELVSLSNLVDLIKTCVESPNFIAKGRTDESIALLELDDTHRFLAVFLHREE